MRRLIYTAVSTQFDTSPMKVHFSYSSNLSSMLTPNLCRTENNREYHIPQVVAVQRYRTWQRDYKVPVIKIVQHWNDRYYRFHEDKEFPQNFPNLPALVVTGAMENGQQQQGFGSLAGRAYDVVAGVD